MTQEIQYSTTPLMQQYQRIKKDFPDALLLFQVGDFYELFYDDAKKAAAFLAITLTSRGKNNGEPIPLCGVPVHTVEHYISKLVKGGFKVVLCNQCEPAVAGRIVERAVAHVFTPGTLTDAHLLDDKSASYLFSFFPAADRWGLLFAELMTAQLFATFLPARAEKTLEAELSRFLPDEIMIPATKFAKPFEPYFKKLGYYTTVCSNAVAQEDARGWVAQCFSHEILERLNQCDAIECALHTLYWYLKKNQEMSLAQFNQISFYTPEDFLLLDAATQRNLELVKNMQDGSVTNSLYEHLDHAATPMGSRMIKKWILRPLIKKDVIKARQDVVTLFVHNVALAKKLKHHLATIGDLERIVGRIMVRRATVSDYHGLMRALGAIPALKQDIILSNDASSLLHYIVHHLEPFLDVYHVLNNALNDDVTSEWIIKPGFDQNLDHLRALIEEGTTILAQLEEREQQKTRINSLKVRYNHIHGYYIEVTKTHLDSVPDYFIRSQSLVGKERFTTQELKIIEADMIMARTRIQQVEKDVFEKIKQGIVIRGPELRKMAFALAHLDALFGISQVAYYYGYVCPVLHEGHEIIIEQGKHPVIAHSLTHTFIPNDTTLTDKQSLWIITGPNMGGKSTYLRQVALITLMAHMGSFVPASKANIGICDRIFTRIGAGDNVAEGKSTFLVEMEETALICSQATRKSLIILDEIGRGTSTFDGIAIAQAVVEYLHNTVQALCLCATHYHELTSLEDQFSGIACYHVASQKTSDRIVLLYKIAAGVADGSFGIEVAKLAELPLPVVQRAQAILEGLGPHTSMHAAVPMTKKSDVPYQQENQRLRERIVELEKQASATKRLLQTIVVDYDDGTEAQAGST